MLADRKESAKGANASDQGLKINRDNRPDIQHILTE